MREPSRALFVVGWVLFLVAFACPVDDALNGLQAAIVTLLALFMNEGPGYFLLALFLNLANPAVVLVVAHYLGNTRSRWVTIAGAVGLLSALGWVFQIGLDGAFVDSWTELRIGYWLWLAGQACIYAAYLRLTPNRATAAQPAT